MIYPLVKVVSFCLPCAGFITRCRCRTWESLTRLLCRRRSEPSGRSSVLSPLMELTNLQIWKYSVSEQSRSRAIFTTVIKMQRKLFFFFFFFLLTCECFFFRLAVMKEEKDAMAKALARLQMSDSSAPGREDWRMNDVVRALEEQLIKERAKSQRSTSKRCQEQRLLVEQVKSLLGIIFVVSFAVC